MIGKTNAQIGELITEENHSYWVIYDDTVSSTTLETGGNVEVRNAIRSKFKRCLLSRTGDVTYLNEYNSSKYPNGDAALSNANYYMVHFPKYYYKCEEIETDKWKFSISDYPFDGWKEERECFVGMFEAYVNTSIEKLTSKPNVQPSCSYTITSFYNYAQAVGADWGLIDYRAHKTIANMFAIMYGSRDISTLNDTIPCSGGTKVYTGQTGSTLSLGNSDGLVDTSSSFLGLEDCYYGCWECVQGIHAMSYKWISYDGGLKVDTSAEALESAGYTNVREIGTAPSTAGLITKLNHGEYADVMPTAIGGSSTTYYADRYYTTTGNRMFLRAGTSEVGENSGVFTAHAYRLSTDTSAYIGTRLAYYGDYTILTSDEFQSKYG